MEKNKYDLGLVSVSFRQNTPKEILDATQKAGLNCIEWGSDVHAPCHDIKRVKEIAALQKEYGIACSSYGTYFRLGETPIGELEQYIRAAKLLDTNVLRLWCGGRTGAEMTNEARGELLSVCRQAAEIAKSSRVTLCMECHKNTFTEDPDDAVWLMEMINSPYFRMYWQPFQWQSTDKNIENAARIAPYAEHIHVFNWKNDQKLCLSDAIAEWRKYLNEFSTPRTLLLEFMPNGTIEELADEAAALKSIIGESV
ncbi:MAG: sugar phosphate isomerase/epimerase [Clostridia bacterium]|nr:sugar phosphate isomerase/epimerase [Clostridia bacterium]